ncbi:hypothetical protein MVEN_00344900 [Mycena venus]|uniref:Uncharacterized protein n=1 Tax=Mycena venus TaxID=2733690 RepID=A0A8H7D7Z9_9AGAR|nr:hypothetical protein MVEN_00344900 [Mycena venus]
MRAGQTLRAPAHHTPNQELEESTRLAEYVSRLFFLSFSSPFASFPKSDILHLLSVVHALCHVIVLVCWFPSFLSFSSAFPDAIHKPRDANAKADIDTRPRQLIICQAPHPRPMVLTPSSTSHALANAPTPPLRTPPSRDTLPSPLPSPPLPPSGESETRSFLQCDTQSATDPSARVRADLLISSACPVNEDEDGGMAVTDTAAAAATSEEARAAAAACRNVVCVKVGHNLNNLGDAFSSRGAMKLLRSIKVTKMRDWAATTKASNTIVPAEE